MDRENSIWKKAVIDAYQLASNQNWIGVSFQISFKVPPNFYKIDRVVVYPTPLKEVGFVWLQLYRGNSIY